MKRVDIDFAAPSFLRTVHRTSGRAWALYLLAFVLAGAALMSAWQLAERRQADQAALAAARARMNVPVVVAVKAPAVAISEGQAAAINAAVLQLNLPWRALHDTIGAATPPDIGLLALEPDARKRSMKITAEARSSDAMIHYVELLKKEELFAAVTLTRHEINELDPNRPVRFQVEAEWMAK